MHFEPDSLAEVLSQSTKLCEEFTDAIPLIDRGSMRFKLARLSAALACRTFSTSDDHSCVIIRPAHVFFIANLLRRIYNSPVFGYTDYTAAVRSTEEIIDPDVIRKKVNETPFPKDFVTHMLHANWVDLFDIQDWCSWERTDALELLSLLVRKYALHREGRKYRKSSRFIELLKLMLEEGFEDRPSHIPEF